MVHVASNELFLRRFIRAIYRVLRTSENKKFLNNYPIGGEIEEADDNNASLSHGKVNLQRSSCNVKQTGNRSNQNDYNIKFMMNQSIARSKLTSHCQSLGLDRTTAGPNLFPELVEVMVVTLSLSLGMLKCCITHVLYSLVNS